MRDINDIFASEYAVDSYVDNEPRRWNLIGYLEAIVTGYYANLQKREMNDERFCEEL